VLTSLNGENFDSFQLYISHTGKVTNIWSDAGTIVPGGYKYRWTRFRSKSWTI